MKSLFRCVVILSALLFLNACPSTDEGCKDASQDCQLGQICCMEKGKETGTCKKPEECETHCEIPCKTNDDCSNAQICTSGCCVAEKDPNRPCESISDCDKKYQCKEKDGKKTCTRCRQSCSLDSECSKINGIAQICENDCCRLPKCESSDDCKALPITPICKEESGECVECLKNSDCASKEKCDGNECVEVECTQDSHCKDATKPKCNITSFKCVEPIRCKNDGDCKDAKLSRCDPKAKEGRGECRLGSCQECTTNNDCGGEGDFCVGKDQGLKDGSRCLNGCEKTSDCPKGFTCSSTIISGKKICFPLVSYCNDPCDNVSCQSHERCEDGKCVDIPDACTKCSEDKECPSGGKCQTYSHGKRCSVKCEEDSDCPVKTGRKYSCLGKQCVDDNECK